MWLIRLLPLFLRIVDETDLYVDVHSKIRVVRPLSEGTQHTRGLSKVVEGLAKVNMRVSPRLYVLRPRFSLDAFP